jgi:hypothetical protein
VVLVGVASLAVPLGAANPHLVLADSSMGNPVFATPNLTWDGGLVVPFKIAGLGNNLGLQVFLNAHLTFKASVTGKTTSNVLVANFGITAPSGGNITLEASASSPGSASLTFDAHSVSPMLISDKNGQVSGTLTIPGIVGARIPDDLACVQVSWTQVTLTFAGQAVALPDVSGQFDSTGSFCQ